KPESDDTCAARQSRTNQRPKSHIPPVLSQKADERIAIFGAMYRTFKGISAWIPGGLFLAGICMVSACHPAPGSSPDLILYNGATYTVQTDAGWTEALAVRDGRVSATGTSEELLAMAGPQTQVIDLKDAFAMPGFIEGHGHFPGLGASLQNLNLLHAKNWPEI